MACTSSYSRMVRLSVQTYLMNVQSLNVTQPIEWFLKEAAVPCVLVSVSSCKRVVFVGIHFRHSYLPYLIDIDCMGTLYSISNYNTHAPS